MSGRTITVYSVGEALEYAERRAEHVAAAADRMARRMGGRFVRDPARWDQFVRASAESLSR